MKKIFILAAALYAGQLFAQDAKLMDRSFWSTSPNLETIQQEFAAEHFNFADIKTGEDPLNLAINNNADGAIIKYLATRPGVDLQRGIHEGRTYLHSAASKGNAEAVDILLKQGADMYYEDVHNQTALTFAAFMGKINLPVLEAFVSNGLDIQKKYENKSDANILLLAASADSGLLMTNYLVSKGVSLQSTDNEGNTVADYGAKLGNVAVVKALIKKGSKIDNNALFMAAQGPFRSANTIEIYRYLVEDVKLDPKAVNGKGQNILHQIVTKQNQEEIIKYFVSKGADINLADREGTTPFMGAASIKDAKTLSFLLTKVKDINAASKEGKTALMNAVQNGNATGVELLLKGGAKIDVVDKQGNPLGYYLIESIKKPRGNKGMPQMASQNGKPNAGFAGRGNAGFGAGQNGKAVNPIADFKGKLNLLKATGLDFTLPLKEGGTLYHLAIEKNNLELLKAMQGLGIDVNAKNNEGLTPLHQAAMHVSSPDILEYLLSVGADKRILTGFDESAYDLASENEQLKANGASLEFLQ